MSSTLELKLKDDDPWHVTKKVFDTITAYLQPDSATPATEAASHLDQLTPMHRRLQDGEEVESPETFFLDFWKTFVEIARQVPRHSTSEDRLLQLVEELSRLPTTSDKGTRIWEPVQPELGNVLRDEWTAPSEFEDTYEPFEQWVNLNSIVAHLFHDGHVTTKLFAFETLATSLEKPQPPAKDQLECNIAAAAYWMTHCASQILEIFRRSESALSATEFNEISSTMFDTETGNVLSMERWRYWKSRFEEFARHEVSPTAQASARQAVQAMDEAAT